MTSSGQNNLEVNHKMLKKESRSCSCRSHERGITLDEVMTIGRYFNDVSMLQTAGVSFAMGNAEIEVKDYAKYLTDTNLESVLAKPSYAQSTKIL